MKRQSEPGAVMVGFDGTDDSRLALRWALLEGQSTGRPIHLVHCHQVLGGAAGRELAGAGRLLLEEGLALCHDYPDVRVTTEALESRGPSASATLLAACEAMEEVVVGCRGHRPPTGRLGGSVSEHLSRHATCSVVTVRPAQDPHEQRVVLGITVPEPAAGALAFAFEYASSRRVGLTAINVWQPQRASAAGVADSVEHYVSLDADSHLAALDDALESWRTKFPDVAVTIESIAGHAASVLRDASEHAGLVVVGRREKRGIGLLLGSVSLSVLRHAKCPVAVVGLTTSRVPSSLADAAGYAGQVAPKAGQPVTGTEPA